MAEGQVTVDGETRSLEQPFFVIATQNPVETLGCFPLPEAQLDRFLMKLSMGMMTDVQEVQMLERFLHAEPLKELASVCSSEEIRKLQEACREVYVHPDLLRYIVGLAQATRTLGQENQGVSPRGTLALLRASQGYAFVQGRDYVVPEDVKKVAVAVLAHRLISDRMTEDQKKDRIHELLGTVKVPTEDWSRR